MKALKLVTLISVLALTISTAHAKGPSENASTASKHSVLAGSHGLKASGQVASGVIAVPLLAVGSVGALSTSAGSALVDVATGSSEQKLEITDKTITADRSPAEVMKLQKNKLESL